MRTLNDIDLAGQQVVLREDLNVPLRDGVIQNDRRLRLALSSIRRIRDAGASVVVLSHLGRPTEGEADANLSLLPVAEWLSEYLGQPAPLLTDITKRPALKPGEVGVLENTRFNVGEEANDVALAKQYAELGDVCVWDAFAVAHRAQASTTGLIEQSKTAVAGPLLVNEYQTLNGVLDHPVSPVVAIIGGAKAQTKAGLIEHLLDDIDVLIPGGGVANTLLAAAQYDIGVSVAWREGLEAMGPMLQQAKQKNVQIMLPDDVVVATSLAKDAKARTCAAAQVSVNEAIYDFGPMAQAAHAKVLASAGTVLWNGPLGVFEDARFAAGTQALARAVANSPAYTVVGGGDTLAALDQLHLLNRMDYVSSGGGALLTLLEGQTLPAMTLLKKTTL